jgi:hypothetical protein
MKRVLASALAVGAVTFAAFWPALSNQFVDWDDLDNFVRNPDYRGLAWNNLAWMFTTLHMGHYQPLAWLTLGLDAVCAEALFGDPVDPRTYHFTNNLLHAANAALVFVLALRLIVRGIGSGGPPAFAGAAVAGLIFGVHPLRVESVAWATERRDLLSGLFLLLAVLAWLRAVEAPSPRRAPRMIGSLVLFALSLLSKVIGVTLPVVLLILDVVPLRRVPGSPRRWVEPAARRVVAG